VGSIYQLYRHFLSLFINRAHKILHTLTKKPLNGQRFHHLCVAIYYLHYLSLREAPSYVDESQDNLLLDSLGMYFMYRFIVDTHVETSATNTVYELRWTFLGRRHGPDYIVRELLPVSRSYGVAVQI